MKEGEKVGGGNDNESEEAEKNEEPQNELITVIDFTLAVFEIDD